MIYNFFFNVSLSLESKTMKELRIEGKTPVKSPLDASGLDQGGRADTGLVQFRIVWRLIQQDYK